MAILVFVFSTSFVSYLSFNGSIDFETWAALLWIILLFTCFNAVHSSFKEEANDQYFYIRSLLKPTELILSKLLYNGFFIALLSIIIFFVLRLFFNVAVVHEGLFLLILFLGSFGMAGVYTLMAFLTARLNNSVILAILGFPLLLPLLLLCIRLTSVLEVQTLPDDIQFNIVAIMLVDFLVLLLSVLLFPYLWKD